MTNYYYDKVLIVGHEKDFVTLIADRDAFIKICFSLSEFKGSQNGGFDVVAGNVKRN